MPDLWIILIPLLVGYVPAARRLAWYSLEHQNHEYPTDPHNQRDAIAVGLFAALLWPLTLSITLGYKTLCRRNKEGFFVAPRSVRQVEKNKAKDERIRELEAQLQDDECAGGVCDYLGGACPKHTDSHG